MSHHLILIRTTLAFTVNVIYAFIGLDYVCTMDSLLKVKSTGLLFTKIRIFWCAVL